MLASILPGFRDARTPLVTGYLYLLAGWVAIGGSERAPIINTRNEYGRDIIEVIDLLGAGVFLTALSLTAFLIGAAFVIRRLPSILFDLLTRIGVPDRWLLPKRRHSAVVVWVGGHVNAMPDRGVHPQRFARSSALGAGMHIDVQDYLKTRSDHGEAAARLAIQAALVDRIDDEFDTLVTRLRVKQPSMWDDYDRFVSEAELRYSIVPPIVSLTVLAAWLTTPAAMLGLAAPALLFADGLASGREARQTVWNALTTGAIKSPIMTQFLKLTPARVEEFTHSQGHAAGGSSE